MSDLPEITITTATHVTSNHAHKYPYVVQVYCTMGWMDSKAGGYSVDEAREAAGALAADNSSWVTSFTHRRLRITKAYGVLPEESKEASLQKLFAESVAAYRTHQSALEHHTSQLEKLLPTLLDRCQTVKDCEDLLHRLPEGYSGRAAVYSKMNLLHRGTPVKDARSDMLDHCTQEG